MKDEMGILKEVGVTAAAHGGIALSEILNKKISLTLPKLTIFSTSQLAEITNDNMVFTLQTELVSGLKGKIIFIIDEQSAFKLIDLCYPDNENHKPGKSTEIGMSVVKEIGNILTSSYINALSLSTNQIVIPSFPVMVNAPLSQIINSAEADLDEATNVIVIDAIFHQDAESIKGNFWLLLPPETAKHILEVCKSMINKED